MPTENERLLFGLVLSLASALVGLKGALMKITESSESLDMADKIRPDMEYAGEHIRECIEHMKEFGARDDA